MCCKVQIGHKTKYIMNQKPIRYPTYGNKWNELKFIAKVDKANDQNARLDDIGFFLFIYFYFFSFKFSFFFILIKQFLSCEYYALVHICFCDCWRIMCVITFIITNRTDLRTPWKIRNYRTIHIIDWRLIFISSTCSLN